MGVDPPFIYDRPSSYTFGGPTTRGFNPRAATQASWAPKQPKPKQDGPLINFNKHPDSYYQSPYGYTKYIPMSPKTNGRVKLAWRSQGGLRILALLGALGAVFCIITIRKTSTAVGWVIRVGPAVALAHTLYATYFLCRGHNSRPPASCASYQMFAGLIDTGLLPFFVISCYMATMDYTSNAYGWSTLFNENDMDYKIIQAFMILCAAVGGLLAMSLILDIYLAITYRKISNLPPDANPLAEKDNLTGAGRTHKRNKSELAHEKHMSNSTLASQRFSQMSQAVPGARRVPFKHTRTDSKDRDSFSIKKDFFNEVRDPYSARASMSQDRGDTALSRPSSAVTPAVNARPAGVGLEHKPARSSALSRPMSPDRPSSWLSYSDYEGMPPEMSDYPQHEPESQFRTMSPVSAMSDHENHLTRNTSNQSEPDRLVTASYQQQPAIHFDQENDMPSPDQISLALPPAYTPPKMKRSREPLGMNPPTPVNQRFNGEGLVPRPLSMSGTAPGYATPPRQALRDTDSNSVMYHTPASRPASFVGSGTKSRFYGNLRSSVGGSPTRNTHGEYEIDDLQRSDTTKSAESGNFEVYASDEDDEYDPYNASRGPQHGAPVVIGELAPGQQWNNQRQISNSTGYDAHNGYAGLDPEFADAIPRRREVSGKVAEEGRSYEFSTSTAELETKPGAAGWARFKGL